MASIVLINLMLYRAVWYDLEEKAYKIVVYRASKEFINAIAPKIKELFDITEADVTIASKEN